MKHIRSQLGSDDACPTCGMPHDKRLDLVNTSRKLAEVTEERDYLLRELCAVAEQDEAYVRHAMRAGRPVVNLRATRMWRERFAVERESDALRAALVLLRDTIEVYLPDVEGCGLSAEGDLRHALARADAVLGRRRGGQARMAIDTLADEVERLKAEVAALRAHVALWRESVDVENLLGGCDCEACVNFTDPDELGRLSPAEGIAAFQAMVATWTDEERAEALAALTGSGEEE